MVNGQWMMVDDEWVMNSMLFTNLDNKKSDNTVLSSFAYTLDSAGNRVGMTEQDGAQTTWSYDDLYQLVREVKRDGAGVVIHDTSYTYDLAQNRTSMTNHLTQSTMTYTYNNMNQLLTAGNVSFTYNANGNTVSKAVSGQTTTYTWDYENKLTRIDYPNGSSNIFSTNADGVRMTANDSGRHRRFIYDGTSIIGEQDIASGNLIVAYDHGNGGLARQTRGTGASYYQFDGLGSTRQMTDSNRAVTDTTSYDAWGNILSSSGTTTNGFKYVGSLGYYADSDSGLMLLGARYYGSGVGRFWSVDPIRDGHNWYGYVGNNPVNRVDPTGTLAAVPLPLILVVGGVSLLFLICVAIAINNAPNNAHCYMCCSIMRCALLTPGAIITASMLNWLWELFFSRRDMWIDYLHCLTGTGLAYIFWRSCRDLCRNIDGY